MKTKTKTVYKVVAIGLDGRMYSTASPYPYKIEYKIGTKAIAKVGLLTAMNDLDNAIYYAENSINAGAILICNAIIENKVPQYLVGGRMFPLWIEEFWKLFEQDRLDSYFGYICLIPDGTVFCKSITPQRIIK